MLSAEYVIEHRSEIWTWKNDAVRVSILHRQDGGLGWWISQQSVVSMARCVVNGKSAALHDGIASRLLAAWIMCLLSDDCLPASSSAETHTCINLSVSRLNTPIHCYYGVWQHTARITLNTFKEIKNPKHVPPLLIIKLTQSNLRINFRLAKPRLARFYTIQRFQKDLKF